MKKIILFAFLSIVLMPVLASAGVSSLKDDLARLRSVDGDYTFAVFGDNRSGDGIYEKVLSKAILRKPMFIVNTGDLIPNPGNRWEWKNFRRMSSGVTVPYFLTPGNHDINSYQSEAVWRDEVDFPGNETYYSFEVGEDLFVVLNTCEPDHDRKITGEQLGWLKKTLNQKRYRYQFVFLHHPLYLWEGATHHGFSLDRFPVFRDQLHKIFADNKVDAVFAGHEHTYRDQGKKDDVHYFVTGGAGAPKYGRDSFNNVVMVEVKTDGVIRVKVIDKEGYLRDEVFIISPK